MSLHRYVTATATPDDPCTGCGAGFRAGANVWREYPNITGARLCDACAELVSRAQAEYDGIFSNDLQLASFFAGVGGFELAARRAGIRPVVSVEIDRAAAGVLADQFPETTILPDITKVTADDLRAAGLDPRRTIYTGGFPCQDLSVAGRRAGMGEGTRSGLFWHLDRLLAEFAPEWFVFENVPGLLSATCPCTGDGACQVDGRGPVRCPGELHSVSGGACVGGCVPAHGGTMGAVLGAVGHRGYGFAYRVLDAQRFGVPQRRRRVFIVGRLGDDGTAPAQVLAEFEGSLGDSAPSPQAWARLAERAGGGARGARGFVDVASTLQAAGGERGYRVDAEAAAGGHLVPATYRKAGRAQTNQDDETWTEADVANTVNTFDVGDTRATELVVTPITTRNATRTTDDGAGFGVGNSGDPAPTVQTNGTTAVGILGDVAHTLTHEGHDASEDGTGRGTPIVANALTAREGKGPDSDVTTTLLAEPAVRRLTPMECERLQGFPDGHTATSNEKPQADSARYKQMGNSLAVPVAEWQLHRLVAVDKAVRR